MLFTQLFVVACALFSVTSGSITPGKYCGLQPVVLKTPGYACIIFDYGSPSSGTLAYKSFSYHSLTIGYDDVSVKENGEISLKRQGFTEKDHPFPNVELRVHLVVDAVNGTINMVDGDDKVLYNLSAEECQRSLSLNANCTKFALDRSPVGNGLILQIGF
ncbi:hypothetical protein FOZ63_008035 [Perkinsus olseni]|uniref:Uncharacterized protein n=1 Tax=Perkinsus olseni TaxID=32597 RepID=A0A7J6PM39_PEROL|nr:hypothetical protein FOZ62_029609 [Perkinsus olseni]KAF4756565.1 hypothetical protein FOZ63_008035 [Perkinsus olseni]